jgi:tetratricopeptide (TPR) repeat protein
MKRINLLSLFLMLLLISCEFKSNEEVIKEKEDEIAKENLEKARLDSINYYLNTSADFLNQKKNDIAILYLDSALTISEYNEKDSILSKRSMLLYEERRFDVAIEDFTTLINSEVNKSINLYKRALCFIGLRKTQEAVDDLKIAISIGNVQAEELHEKINPLKRRIAYYVTRCCDGSTSNATGRGACSRHGGVCNWNEPVYEEYRKY